MIPTIWNQREFIQSEEAKKTLLTAFQLLLKATELTPMVDWPWLKEHHALAYDGLTEMTKTVSYKLFANHQSGVVGDSDQLFVVDLLHCRAAFLKNKTSDTKIIMEKWGPDGEFFQHLSAHLLVPCLWICARVMNPNPDGGSEILVDRVAIFSQQEAMAECLARVIPLLSSGPLSRKQKAGVMRALIKAERIYHL
ncbi:MAG: hypothetical protein PHU56_01495 [Candidatus Pacebacteria bacterium]|nr:hypothetical protein [Candidatus Paceibacterota bacterium]